MSALKRDPSFYRRLEELIDQGMTYEQAGKELARQIFDDAADRADAARTRAKEGMK